MGRAHSVIRQVVEDLAITDLTAEQRAELLSGINRLLLASALAPAETGAAIPSPRSPMSQQQVAARRWKLGHHLFHHVLSLMNSRIDAISAALHGEDWTGIKVMLDELTVLYDAATATMHYASNFPPDAYENTVRPSMEPPWMPPGFSGVFNQEHAVLLRRLGDLKPRLRGTRATERMPEPVARSARALWKSQSRNRREHKLICEKFVPGGESLLQQHFDETSGED
ncbi:hypothetical protein GCM10010174_49720 [Kutzneria viridogrisea]|uniref:Uncharacterized protein n=1 Tax=Kutzneria viridogrisea TaxID=47990 RepID=A0ABR6B8R0_9PSEU|nr:hypothetical protein [Kutzneria viridogrisea]